LLSSKSETLFWSDWLAIATTSVARDSCSLLLCCYCFGSYVGMAAASMIVVFLCYLLEIFLFLQALSLLAEKASSSVDESYASTPLFWIPFPSKSEFLSGVIGWQSP
jgi:hypothetical protein